MPYTETSIHEFIFWPYDRQEAFDNDSVESRRSDGYKKDEYERTLIYHYAMSWTGLTAIPDWVIYVSPEIKKRLQHLCMYYFCAPSFCLLLITDDGRNDHGDAY